MRCLVILLAACGGGTIVAPDVTTPSRSGNPADDSTASSSQVLRQLTGDATKIADDWTASEGGMTFAVVKDGDPDKPRRPGDDAKGREWTRSQIGLYQPNVNNGHTLYFDQVTVTTSFAAANAALGQ